MTYNDLPGVRWSDLRAALQSPKHLQHQLANKRSDSPAMAFGRAVHCAVLEPQRFAVEAFDYPEEHVTPSGAVSTSKPTREWLASLPAETMLLTTADRDAIARIVEAIEAHADASLWLAEAREREVEVQWTETIDGTDVACKAKADAYCPRLSLLWDLKTVGGFAPFSVHRVEREIVSRLYFAQAGHYAKGLEHSGRRVDSVGWVCVESKAPFDVIVIEADADLMQACRDEADKALIAYAHAVGSGDWHGCAPARVVMSPPAWMLKAEDDATELELDFEENT